jgi:hypothetical protein
MTTRNTLPDNESPVNRDALLETFAAELTLAAYRVALRTRTQGTWLDLQLDLWKALADTVKTWEKEIVSIGVANVKALPAAISKKERDRHDENDIV